MSAVTSRRSRPTRPSPRRPSPTASRSSPPGDALDADAVLRVLDRLADVGVDVDATVVTGTDESAVADVVVPASAVTAPGEVPVCDVADDPFVAGVAAAIEAVCDVSLDVESEEKGLFGW